MYAYAAITLCAEAYGYRSSFTTGANDALTFSSSSNSTTIYLWLSAGDILTKTETAASASASGTSGLSCNSVSTATVLLNVGSGAVNAGTVKASGSAGGHSGNGMTINVAGTANVEWVISEFNTIT
jgi:hypothetical protein